MNTKQKIAASFMALIVAGGLFLCGLAAGVKLMQSEEDKPTGYSERHDALSRELGAREAAFAMIYGKIVIDDNGDNVIRAAEMMQTILTTTKGPVTVSMVRAAMAKLNHTGNGSGGGVEIIPDKSSEGKNNL